MAHVGAINFKGGLKDISGYNHPMEYVGTPQPSAGRFDRGLGCFNGNGFRLLWSSGSYYGNILGGKTFQFSVKGEPGSSGAKRLLYERFTWKLYADNGSGSMGMTFGGLDYTANTNVLDGQWHHILVCWNRVPKSGDVLNSLRIWVDGTLKLDTARTYDYSESTNEWAYFGVSSTGTEHLNAILSDIKIWNDPVYPDEITYFRDNPVVDTNRGLFAFNSVSQGKFRDASQHRHHLTTTGNETIVAGQLGNSVYNPSAEQTYAFNPGDMDRITLMFWMYVPDRTQVGNIVRFFRSGVECFGVYHVGSGVMRGGCVRNGASGGTSTVDSPVAWISDGVWMQVVVQAWASSMQIRRGGQSGDSAGAGGGSVAEPINMPSFVGINEMRIGKGVRIDNLRVISNWVDVGAVDWLPTQALVEPKLPGFYGKGGVDLTARMKTATGYTDLRPSGVEIVVPPEPPTNLGSSGVTYSEFRLTWTPPDIPQDNVPPSVPTGLNATGTTHQQFTLGWQEATDG